MAAIYFSSSHSPTQKGTGQLDEGQIKKLVTDAFGEDIQYLEGKAIPPEKFNALFSKAQTLWLAHNSPKTSHNNPQTALWKKVLIQPLVEEGIRSENVESKALLFAWVHTLRFGFSFKAGLASPQELEEVISTISAQLQLQIGMDHQKIVTLLVLLNARVKNDVTEFDYVGRGELCKLLCHLYYHNSSVTLEDLTVLCRSPILSLASPNGSNSEFYLAALIACKAEQLLPKAAAKVKENFLEAFKHIGSYGSQHVALRDNLEPFFAKASAANVNQYIGPLAQSLSQYPHNIK